MTTPEISVIVPIYNAEAYLPQCLDSILAQEYRNFELILLNDGSTDASGELCERYARQDSRIRLITQSNGGASKARNAGIKEAVGKYVTFFDADDWADPDYLSILLCNMTDDSGLSASSLPNDNCFLAACGLSINQKRVDDTLCEAFTPAEVQTSMFSSKGMGGYPFCKLFVREQILSHNLFFDSSLSIGEDLLFAVQYISYATGVIRYDHRQPYHYRRGHMSVTYQRYDSGQTFDWRNLSYVEALRRCSLYLLPDTSVREAYEVCYTNAAEQTLRAMAANDYRNPELYRELYRRVVGNCWRCLRSPYSALSSKIAICLSVISPKLSLLAWRLWYKIRYSLKR